MNTTPANRHQPVFEIEWLERAYEEGRYEEAVRGLAFNRQFPSRRAWHHHVHQQFDLPCDDMCKPRKRYSGPDQIKRIKSALRIEDIAGRLTTLRGNSVLKGKCPLHGEQRGQAFTVWVDEQKWKCFGACNTGGDVLDLISECMDRGIDWQAYLTST